ncbi:hypothetical protein CWI36_0049p0020 [Hamiltosporidium magnivora]|uniref:C2H2-type domain-containing protein n=1 Tax=Hamiltosporidium magnivora TaxID=148818 RepID=A0A4V2JWU9_9MICR|nr:hypothetical protein CWI36_0049p0020 [Hamiltosporidium magnivora]
MRRRNYDQRYMEEPIINMKYLLEQPFIITEKELKHLLPEVDYSTYLKSFYSKKIHKFYNSFHEHEWFKERYIYDDYNIEKTKEFLQNYVEFTEKIVKICWDNTNEEIKINVPILNEEYFVDPELINVPKYNIIMKNISSLVPISLIQNLALKCPNSTKFSVLQSDDRESYKRSCIISLQNENNIDDSVRSMRNKSSPSCEFYCDKFILNENNMSFANVSFSQKDILFAKKIIKSLSDRYSVPDVLETIESDLQSFFVKYIEKNLGENEKMKKDAIFKFDKSEILDFYILLLRYVFHYCFYCCRMFGSHMEMARCCGKYHIRSHAKNRDFFTRKLKIYTMDKDFSFMKDIKEEDGMIKHIIKIDEEQYKCNSCIKVFAQAHNVANHIKRKHPELIESIKKDMEIFSAFINKLDPFVLSIIEGINDTHLPSYLLKIEEDIIPVKYDIPKVFSGFLDKPTI